VKVKAILDKIDSRPPQIGLAAHGDRCAAVWIDHREANVVHVSPGKVDVLTVATPQHIHRRHPKGIDGAKEHPDDAIGFFAQVAKSLEGTESVLVVGPSTAKLDFIRYVHEHEHPLETRIVGVETVDHPSSNQLVAYVKRYFGLSEPRE
jgi:stalled ribosome rescue protein Dom34